MSYHKTFCITNGDVRRIDEPSYTRFLRDVMHEENRMKEVKAQEVQMTCENPMLKEQEMTENISAEMKLLEREKFLEEKRKIALHKNEAEIRELDAQIKRASVQRQLIHQKAFKSNKFKEELQERLEETKRFQEICEQNRQIALEKERDILRKKAALRQDLLKQMQEKIERRELEKQLVKKEREGKMKLLLNTQQEIENEEQYKIKMKRMLNQEINEAMREAEMYKKQNKALLEGKDIQYGCIMERHEEDEKVIAKRKEVIQERSAISERIGKDILLKEMEKRKREQLLEELLYDERLAKEDARYKTKLEKQLERARCLQEDFDEYFLRRNEEKIFNREEKKRRATENLKNIQDLQRQDNELKNIKLEKNKEYRQDILNAIKYKMVMRKLEDSEKKVQYDHMKEMEKKRQEEIDAEKLRLLSNVSLENLQFLPKKTVVENRRLNLELTRKESKEKT